MATTLEGALVVMYSTASLVEMCSMTILSDDGISCTNGMRTRSINSFSRSKMSMEEGDDTSEWMHKTIPTSAMARNVG